MTSEQLRGEPEESPESPTESLVLDAEQLSTIDGITDPAQDLQAESTEAAVNPFAIHKDGRRLFSDFMIDSAGKEADAGVSRASNEPRVAAYLNLFGLSFADPSGKPYPFCAAGLGWVACRAYCDMDPTIAYGEPPTSAFRKVVPTLKSFYFLPHPSCIVMVNNAKQTGRWVGPGSVPLPGWLVFYNWGGGHTPEHVGLVVSASETTLRTIEFNTTVVVGGNQRNGGVVARKNRDGALRFVLGFIKTYSSAEPLVD